MPRVMSVYFSTAELSTPAKLFGRTFGLRPDVLGVIDTSPRIDVHEINGLDQLREFREPWNDLLTVTPGATYFHSFDWLATYWEHFGAGQQLRVLLVAIDDRLIGIVPLVVTMEHTRVGPLRVLTYPLHSWGSFYGPIGAEQELILRAAFTHIRETPRDWDLLDLLWVDAAGTDDGCTEAALALAGWKTRGTAWKESAQIDIEGGWDAYWAGCKTHWRSNVRRCERRLAERSTLEHVRYRPRGVEAGESDPRWDLYDACERIAQQSWQGASTTGTTLSHESVRAYLRDTHATAVRFGGLDLNLLLLAGRPVAFAYNYHYRGHVYGLRAGFDAEAANEGAGTVLLYKMIEDGCRRGDRLIDLGPGSLEAKRYWQTRLATAYRYTIYPSSPRAQLLRLLHWLKRPGVQT